VTLRDAEKVLQLRDELERDVEKPGRCFDVGGLAVAVLGGTSLQIWLSSEIRTVFILLSF